METTGRGFLGAIGASAVFADFTPAAAQSAPPGANRTVPQVEKDVVFGRGGDTDLHCNIYRPPASTTKRMAILHYHGGGFRNGNKSDVADRLTPLTALGYVNIAAQYRLAGVANWPAQIEDVKTAVRWTRANATSLGTTRSGSRSRATQLAGISRSSLVPAP